MNQWINQSSHLSVKSLSVVSMDIGADYYSMICIKDADSASVLVSWLVLLCIDGIEKKGQSRARDIVTGKITFLEIWPDTRLLTLIHGTSLFKCCKRIVTNELFWNYTEVTPHENSVVYGFHFTENFPDLFILFFFLLQLVCRNPGFHVSWRSRPHCQSLWGVWICQKWYTFGSCRETTRTDAEIYRR